MMKYFKLIKLGFLPYDVLVVQGRTVLQTKTYVSKKYGLDIFSDFPDTWSDRQQGKTIHLDSHQTIIWLKWPPKQAPWTLAHEAVHAMGFILHSCGLPHNQENDEMIAYGVDYILRQCLEPNPNNHE